MHTSCRGGGGPGYLRRDGKIRQAEYTSGPSIVPVARYSAGVLAWHV